MGVKIYDKPFLSVKDQVALLRSRGLAIDVNECDAISYLSTVNYYRFTGYAIPFQVDREHFKKGSRFSAIQAVYSFDRELRRIVFSACEAIELTFRTILAREFTRKYGPLGYLNSANFPCVKTHDACAANMCGEFARSNAICAQHFRNTYSNPPLWAVVEVCSFGSLVRFFRTLHKTDQNAISSYFSMRGDILASYVHHVSVLRNMCAHHARLYDHRFAYAFKPLKEWRSLNIQDTSSLFYQCALIYRLLITTDAVCFCRDQWKRELCEYLMTIPIFGTFDPRIRAAIPNDPIGSVLWV